MKVCVRSLRLTIVDAEKDGDVSLPSNVPLSAPTKTSSTIAKIVPAVDGTTG